MTPLAAILAALVAVDPSAAAEPPAGVPSAPDTAAESPGEPPPSESAGEQAPAPPEDPALAAPAPAGTSVSRHGEWSFLGGYAASNLMGIAADGWQLRGTRALAHGASAGLPPLQVAAELFAAETVPGLRIRGGALGVEVWGEAVRGVRLLFGFGVAGLGYRRATNREWPLLLTPGLRGGIEIAPVRFRRVALVIGAHGSAHLGPWVSGSLSAGLRIGDGRRTTR